MDSVDSFKTLLASWFEEQQIPENLQTILYEKLRDDVFDSGTAFGLAMVQADDDDDGDEEGEEKEEDGDGDDGEQKESPVTEYVLLSQKDITAKQDIWLVDHFWTFLLRDARKQLEENETLRHRLAPMLKVVLKGNGSESAKEDAALLYQHLWKQVHSYRLPSPPGVEQKLYESCWFVHDEVGSSIVQKISGKGNMRLAPMPVCFPEKGCVFSVMWCVEDMEEGTIATTAATHGFEARSGHEVVDILYGDASDEADAEQITRAKRQCVNAWLQWSSKLKAIADARRLPNGVTREEREYSSPPAGKLPLRFYTDSKAVSENVADSEFFKQTLVPEEADVMWLAHYAMKETGEFPHASFISQFPEEGIFTNKQGLAQIVQQQLGCVQWYPPAYDGCTQLKEFIGDYLTRQVKVAGKADDDEDAAATPTEVLRENDGTNLWITKPMNLARSIDMTVSDNLECLLKVIENGPKMLCKYIANTATLRGRKFDLRFIIGVRSFNTTETPLEAYVYDVFWTRFAVEQYSLDSYDVYEKHWTVMNYQSPDRLLQLHYNDFIPEFNAEYAKKGLGEHVWENDVYPKILAMMGEMLGAVPPVDCKHDRFRAIYGVDVMVREIYDEADPTKTVALQPVLLEVTYSPDCGRACRYHPSFFNDIFKTLFIGQPVNMTRLYSNH